jgi:hypothetical protein
LYGRLPMMRTGPACSSPSQAKDSASVRITPARAARP